MLRLDPATNSFVPLERQAELQPKSFFEQYDLGEFLTKSPQALFADAGLELLAISVDDQPLAVDADGRVYVIAFQKGGRRPDLSQALEQASRIASASSTDILDRVALVDRSHLSSFLQAPFSQLNRAQGVVLIAESFDEGTLRTILWLQGRYGLHISCIQLTLLADEGAGREFAAARVASLETLQDAPERWIVADAEPQEKGAEPAAVLRPSQPEWRRDFAAVFDDPEPEESLGTFPIDHLPLPIAEEPTAESIATLFDEPVAAADAAFDEAEGERRIAPRSPEFHARRLRLDHQGRLLGARLVDFSEQGLGVEVLSPLPVGAEVAVNGEVAGEDGLYSITGFVIVEHCRSRQDGVCRIGFSLAKAKVERLNTLPEDFDRR